MKCFLLPKRGPDDCKSICKSIIKYKQSAKPTIITIIVNLLLSLENKKLEKYEYSPSPHMVHDVGHICSGVYIQS